MTLATQIRSNDAKTPFTHFFCPMVPGGGGDWIQPGGKLLNPYFGSQMLHCGESNKTPWNTEREYTEAEYEQRFAELLPRVRDMGRCIFNVHVPPHGTGAVAGSLVKKRLRIFASVSEPPPTGTGLLPYSKQSARRSPPLVGATSGANPLTISAIAAV